MESLDATVSAQPSEWQPIDTAPRDGTPILAYDSLPENATAMFTCYFHRWTSNSGSWLLCRAGEYCDSTAVEPTHWMPLPDPPVKRAAS